MIQIIQLRVGDFAVDMKMDFPGVDVNRKRNILFEPDLVQALTSILRKGDTVIDGGANIGCVSLPMAALVGNEGKVFAFEPADDNLYGLRRNIILNNVTHIVEVIDKPLWSWEETVTLHLSKAYAVEHSLGDLDVETSGTQEMIATTIDDLDLKPRLIKLDIEGAEVEALKGAWRTIIEHRCYIICEMNSGTLKKFGESPASLRAFVKQQFDYDTFLLTKWHQYPVFLPPGADVVSTTVPNVNVLMATQEMVAEAYPKLNYDKSLEYI